MHSKYSMPFRYKKMKTYLKIYNSHLLMRQSQKSQIYKYHVLKKQSK